MTSFSRVRSSAAAAVAVAAALAGAAAMTPTSADAVSTEQRAVPKTTITFVVADCEGCTLHLTQARWTKGPGHDITVWASAERTVEDGAVAFTVPTKHTRGMSMEVGTPWERGTGYVTNLAFRYGGERAGNPIGFREARGKTKGSACWAGTTEDAVTIPLTIRPVRVDGVQPHARGSIAFASVTQDWMVPMRDIWDGVMGAQDVNVCGER